MVQLMAHLIVALMARRKALRKVHRMEIKRVLRLVDLKVGGMV